MKLLDTIRYFKVFHRPGPEIILDFVFEDGLFYISIKNIGAKPAYKVSTQFDKTIVGVEGKKTISELPLFKCIEFLPPDKEIKAFLDTSSSYFSRNEPTVISTKIRYEDYRGKKYLNTIKHNLEIYREIGYIQSVF
ncbi:MAG: hypothetical protein GY774_02500 [Planctomycetes bacterium]|nr:hypothetical protein [Planctomycetota bacterium]